VTEATYRQFEKLIWQTARKYWRLLSPNVQAFYDLDDMAAELNLVAVYGLDERFDPDRGIKPITFLHAILHNHCRSILIYHGAQRRAGITVNADDVLPWIPICDDRRAGFEIVHGFERVLQDASDDLRETVSDWLWNGTRKISADCAEELRGLCRRHRFNYWEMQTLLGMI
jgi:DNA-directed RNA polymerase specialized sigma24 family protein